MKKFIRIHLLAILLQGFLMTTLTRGLFQSSSWLWLDYIALGFDGLILLSFVMTVDHYISEVRNV